MSMEELQQAAKDPEAFEAYVLKQQQVKKEKAAAAANGTADTIGKEEKPKGKYVPIEQWDKERSRDDVSWEERVKYDGQRFGNRFQQNEILRKNLKSW